MAAAAHRERGGAHERCYTEEALLRGHCTGQHLGSRVRWLWDVDSGSRSHVCGTASIAAHRARRCSRNEAALGGRGGRLRSAPAAAWAAPPLWGCCCCCCCALLAGARGSPMAAMRRVADVRMACMHLYKCVRFCVCTHMFLRVFVCMCIIACMHMCMSFP